MAKESSHRSAANRQRAEAPSSAPQAAPTASPETAAATTPAETPSASSARARSAETREVGPTNLPAPGATTDSPRSRKAAEPGEEKAHAEVENPNAGKPAPQSNERRFKMLTNSAGFTKDQVVTEREIAEAHAGVKVADWIRRKIVEPTNDQVSPVQ
jgi:hypothetical protein